MSTGVALWSSPLTNPLRAGPWPRAPPCTRENRLPTGWVTAVCHVPGPDRGPPHMHTHTHLHTCAHTTRTPQIAVGLTRVPTLFLAPLPTHTPNSLLEPSLPSPPTASTLLCTTRPSPCCCPGTQRGAGRKEGCRADLERGEGKVASQTPQQRPSPTQRREGQT